MDKDSFWYREKLLIWLAIFFLLLLFTSASYGVNLILNGHNNTVLKK